MKIVKHFVKLKKFDGVNVGVVIVPRQGWSALQFVFLREYRETPEILREFGRDIWHYESDMYVKLMV